MPITPRPDWHFTTPNARIKLKLKHLYPSIWLNRAPSLGTDLIDRIVDLLSLFMGTEDDHEGGTPSRVA